MTEHPAQNLFLIGPMAAGKTTVGKMLAKELALEFIDTDQEIERRSGASVAWIFDVEGEESFRRREIAVIEDFTQKSAILLATGGGAVLRPENRHHLTSRGTVVFLDTSVELQMQRTEKDKKRPLLRNNVQNWDKKKVLTELRCKRQPLYQEIADITVFAGTETSKHLVQKIIRLLSEKDLLKCPW